VKKDFGQIGQLAWHGVGVLGVPAKKPTAIGIKAHFPGFIETALAKRSQPRPSR